MKLSLKILAQIPNSLEILSLKLEILQKYIGSLMFYQIAISKFSIGAISFDIAWKS